MKQRGTIVNGPALRAVRIAKGWTVREAAKNAGISGPLWSQLESGTRGASEESFTAIVRALGLDDPAAIKAATAIEAFAEAERARDRRNEARKNGRAA